MNMNVASIYFKFYLYRISIFPWQLTMYIIHKETKKLKCKAHYYSYSGNLYWYYNKMYNTNGSDFTDTMKVLKIVQNNQKMY